MQTRPPAIQLEDVRLNLASAAGAVNILNGVSLGVGEGETIALLGPSGSGKSTCLRVMAGLIDATIGQALTRGKPLLGINRDVALVFQSFALFPWETVYENIAIALKPLAMTPGKIKERVRYAIDLVGLEGFEEAYPRELSGGMKQRVGIARALVMERPVLFLDEPFEGIDPVASRSIKDLLNLMASKGVTIFLTSHILEVVQRLVESFAIIVAGEIVLSQSMAETMHRGETLEDLFFEHVGGYRTEELEWVGRSTS